MPHQLTWKSRAEGQGYRSWWCSNCIPRPPPNRFFEQERIAYGPTAGLLCEQFLHAVTAVSWTRWHALSQTLDLWHILSQTLDLWYTASQILYLWYTLPNSGFMAHFIPNSGFMAHFIPNSGFMTLYPELWIYGTLHPKLWTWGMMSVTE